ncbi:MAG: hypothetical protein ABF624_02075 [Liquorilactobacillus ghanensis]|uniref:hypothetical protein n=1 Tax=Liquorilactobacillus ghanensis TaxID=399370 RepID=UPI0039ED3FDA
MKFADYFEDAIAYGESLGLRNDTHQDSADILVKLSEPRQAKYDDGTTFHPRFLIAWERLGIEVDTVNTIHPLMTVEQQLKLVSMFVSAYEQYLADKKEPVAADSSK